MCHYDNFLTGDQKYLLFSHHKLSCPMEFFSYLDGKHKPSEKRVTKINPFNNEELGQTHLATVMDLVLAIKAAKVQLGKPIVPTLEERIKWVKAIYLNLEKMSAEISLQQAKQQGLSLHFVQQQEIEFSLDLIKRYLKEVEDFAVHEGLSPIPTGLIGIILPWHLSFRACAEFLIPSILAGNACVILFSEKVPSAIYFWSLLLQSAELPAGWVNLLIGDVEELGPILSAHPGVNALVYSGSYVYAEKILKHTTGQFKKIQMYCGGKNSLLILPGANLRENIFAVMEACMIGQGQLPFNTHRIFLLEKELSDSIEVFQDYFSSLKPATRCEDYSPWLPVIDKQHFQMFTDWSVQMQNEQAKTIDLKIETPIEQSGYFVKPLFLKDLPNCSDFQQNETYGPVFIVNTVKYVHEMVKWSNLGFLGHSAVIWGEPENAIKLAEKLQVGKVWINNWMEPACNITGLKSSFFGNPDRRIFGTFYSSPRF